MLSRLSVLFCGFLLLSSPSLAHAAPSLVGHARAFPAPPINARAGLLMDATTGRVLVAKNPHLQLAMASTTKMMTALLAIQLGHLSDRITVPRGAFNFESDATVMGLHPDEVVTLQDLLYGLLLPSGADAANTIAIHYGGSEAHFVDLMNQEAAALGMRDTHYATAHGLPAPDQFSSVYDLAILARDISAIPVLMQIVDTRTHLWNGHLLTSVNHVLFWYPGVDGIKPGFTYEAGLCQVLDARRDGRHIIVALLNTPNLVVDARDLLNYGLRDFTWFQSTIPTDLPGDGPLLALKGTDIHGPYMYYPASGHYLRGKLAAAYAASGGPFELGLPRTEQLPEGNDRVQFFQNGALALDSAGHVTRLPLGLTPLPIPAASPTPTPLPLATRGATKRATPRATATPAGKRTLRQVVPRPTSTRLSLPFLHTATPTPGRPSATPTPKPTRPQLTPTPTPVPSPATASFFRAFLQVHHSLGSPTGAVHYQHGYALQLFTYGALVYDASHHAVYRLPLGDQMLAAQRFLPPHPGTAYPPGFAPASILKALGWP